MLLEVALLLGLKDIDGVERFPLKEEKGREAVLIFVTHDCPISNAFAPEIARVCSEYRSKGADCTLVYVDPTLSDEAARDHAKTFGHGGYPKIVDRKHELVKAAGATVTPEVAVFDADGRIVYRGRIDNSFAALGQSRRQATVHDLRDALDATLTGKPALHSETKALGCFIPDLGALK
jgi:thiol-disulfide isomerase/thioredoxin